MKSYKKYFIIILVIAVILLCIVKNFVIPAVHYGYIPFVKHNIVLEDYKPSYEERAQIVYISEHPQAFFFPAESIWYGSIIIDKINYPVVASFLVGDESFDIHDLKSSVYFYKGKPVIHTQDTNKNPSLFYGDTGYTKDGVEFKLRKEWDIESEENIPKKIVFKKYNTKDVDLESLGFDLSFLSELESLGIDLPFLEESESE